MPVAMPLFSKTRKDTTDDGQMELVEHLAELRNRILRVGLYVAVAMVLTYNVFPFLYRLLFAPAYLVLYELKAEHDIDARPVFSGIQDAFLLRLETSLFAGIILSLPLILWEIWGFVRPALTKDERAPVRFLAPFAAFLMIAGLGTGYGSLREAYRWMSQYIVDIQGATLLQNAKDYLILTVKILAAFGLGFQLPVVLLFLARVGILNAKMMTTYWRQAVFLIVALVGIFTPTGDPMTMVLMAVPMAGLYLISIVLVRIFEPAPDGAQRNDFVPKLLVSLVPASLLTAVGIWLWNINPPARADKIIREFNTPQSVKALETKVQKLEEAASKPSPAPSATIEDLARRIETLEKRIEALEKPAAPPAPGTTAPTPAPTAR